MGLKKDASWQKWRGSCWHARKINVALKNTILLYRLVTYDGYSDCSKIWVD